MNGLNNDKNQISEDTVIVFYIIMNKILKVMNKLLSILYAFYKYSEITIRIHDLVKKFHKNI